MNQQSGNSTLTIESALNSRNTVRWGFVIITLFLLVFVAWASTMSYSTAAIAQGKVGVAGQKKQVQHLSGGIVKQILVSNGDQVVAGQPLVILDASAVRSRHNVLTTEQTQLCAEQARWHAVSRATPTITRPACLPASAATASLQSLLQEQNELLAAHHRVRAESTRDLEHVRVQAIAERTAAEQRLKHLQNLESLVAREIAEYEALAKNGLVTRSQTFTLKNQLADITLDQDEARSMIEQALQRSDQATTQNDLLTSQYLSEAAQQSTRISARLAVLELEVAQLDAELARAIIKSPIAGQILNSTINTVGGIISPGQTLMEVMPIAERLQIESLVDPKDRDAIHIGQLAEVRFNALDRRSTFPVTGVVKLIAADSQVTADSLQPTYAATIELQDDATALVRNGQIHPGMQAEVLIITGRQTLLNYLISPVANSINRSLRES